MRRNDLTYDHRTRGNERELIRKCKFQNDNTVASGAPTTEAIPAKARAMPKPGPPRSAKHFANTAPVAAPIKSDGEKIRRRSRTQGKDW